MTDEEKKRQQELDGSVSQSITQPAQTQETQQPDTASQSQQEAEQSQKELQSDSGASIGRRTSTGTILNYDPNADSAYQSAIQALQEVQRNAPAYTDSYAGDLTALYEKIVNRAPFRYDINGDPLYQQYKDEYLKGGRLSMMDTMGQAAALTGGYGNDSPLSAADDKGCVHDEAGGAPVTIRIGMNVNKEEMPQDRPHPIVLLRPHKVEERIHHVRKNRRRRRRIA